VTSLATAGILGLIYQGVSPVVQRSNDGLTYYTFEFLAKASNFTRHGLGTVAIKDGTTSSYSLPLHAPCFLL